MNENSPMPMSTRIVQICLFLVAAIAMFGGSVQMYLGEPTTTPRLDNVHRFMAGVYFSSGLIAFYAARTVRTQTTLVYLVAVAALLGGIGRLVSMSIVGLPEPAGLWLGYLLAELIIAPTIVIGQFVSKRKGQ